MTESGLNSSPAAGARGEWSVSIRLGLAAFCLLAFAFGFTHQRRFNYPTPVSRLDLLHAVYQDRTLRIDTYHTNTLDKAFFEGHYYSDKAPGTVVLALPFFFVAAWCVESAGIALESATGWLATSWAACALALGLSTAAGGLACWRWLSRFVPERIAFMTMLAVFLGAVPLPYTTMMFSHGLVVALLSIALWAISKQSDSATNGAGTAGRIWLAAHRWDVGAGLACGWAVASEYTAGIVVVGIFLWLLFLEWRRAVPFTLGAIPPLLMIPAYSWACLGDPFTLPYSYQASFPPMQEGLYAIKWPDGGIAFKLLFGPDRGLLFWSPFLAMMAFGYPKLFQRSRALFWLAYAAPALRLVVISGRVWDWPAGPSFGPRYLAPILPLLALPCALGSRRFPRLGASLALVSILLTLIATLTDACPFFQEGSTPLFNLHVPLWLKGDFSPNLGTVLGLPPYVAVSACAVALACGVWCIWRRLPDPESQEPKRIG